MTSVLRTILVPIDFSPLSVCAFRFALQLADRTGACIRLLHVVEHSNRHSVSSIGEVLHGLQDDLFVLKLLKKAQRQLYDLTNANTNPTLDVRHLVRVGHPGELILETIQENPVDLVVIGISRTNWLDRLLVGSTAEKVVQNAACPVITLKCGIDHLSEMRHIVLAFDPDEDQTAVVAELKKLQALLEAHLHVLLVITPTSFRTSSESNDQLRAFAQTYQLENYSTHAYSARHLEDGLFGFAQEINADILAFATHHQHRLLRVLSARSEQNIIHHAPQPVWTFNPAVIKAESGSQGGDFTCVN